MLLTYATWFDKELRLCHCASMEKGTLKSLLRAYKRWKEECGRQEVSGIDLERYANEIARTNTELTGQKIRTLWKFFKHNKPIQ